MNATFAGVRPLLYPFSWLYQAGVALRNRAFDAGVLSVAWLNVPVISVGNIVTGGVGKTPLVQHITAYCTSKGKRVGVVSRGYKRKSSGVVDVSNGAGTIVGPDQGGDEAVQIALARPEAIVVVGERRVDAARRAEALGAEIVIVDDGYQHRYLGRDLNIVVLDSRVDLRQEAMLPAGNLREPLTSIDRANIVALSHAPAGENPEWLTSLKEYSASTFVGFRYRVLAARSAFTRAAITPESSRNGKVLAFSGIGNHRRFLETVRSAGYSIGAELCFRDHHSYSADDFHRIESLMAEHGCRSCVTTEKDVVRMGTESAETRHFLRERDVLYVPIEIDITVGGLFFQQKIDDCLNRTS